MSDNYVRNVLSWKVDTQSVQQAANSSRQIGDVTVAQAARTADAFTQARAITAQYDGTLGKLGATASANLLLLEQDMRDAALDTERLRQTTEAAAREYDDLGRSADRAATSASRAAEAGGGGGVLATARSAAGTAGGVLATVGGSQAASAVSSILGLAATLGPVGAVAGVATVAFSALQAELAANAEEARDYANSLKSNAELVAGGATTSEVQTQIDRLQTANSVVSDELSRLNEYKAEISEILPGAFDESFARIGNAISGLQDNGNTQLFDNFNNLLLEISARTGKDIQTVAQLDEYINSVQQTTNEYGTQIDNLNRLLQSGALAANDRSAAEEQLKALYAELDRVQLDRVAAELAADGQTAAQRQARIDDIQREIDAYQTLIETGAVSGDTVTDLEAKIGSLRVEQEAYANTIKSTADAVEMAAQKQKALEEATKAAADALEARNDQYIDAVDREVSAREKATELEGKINETVAERIRDIEALQAQSTAKVGEIEAKTARDREKVVQDSQDRITKLLRDTGNEQNDAVGRRDADAYRLTTRQAADALDDQQLADKRRLQSITETAQEAVTTEQAAARARVRTIEQGADRTVAALQKQVNDQNFLAQQARDSQVFLAASTAGSVINAQTKMYSDMNTLAYNNAYTVAQSFQNGWNAGLGGAYGGASSFPTLSSTYGAYQPMTTARVEEIATKQYLKIKMAARGGRMIIP